MALPQIRTRSSAVTNAAAIINTNHTRGKYYVII